jgi:hypothetical protein
MMKLTQDEPSANGMFPRRTTRRLDTVRRMVRQLSRPVRKGAGRPSAAPLWGRHASPHPYRGYGSQKPGCESARRIGSGGEPDNVEDELPRLHAQVSVLELTAGQLRPNLG